VAGPRRRKQRPSRGGGSSPPGEPTEAPAGESEAEASGQPRTPALGQTDRPGSGQGTAVRAEPRGTPPTEPPTEPRTDPPRGRRARGEARDAELRAALAPLAPGERPRSLLAAVAVCTVLGAANAIAFAAGAKIEGRHPGAGVLAFTALMVMLAGGMWARRYLAVLAFEALLALAVLAFSLFLIEASNLEAVLLCVAVIAGAGWLFWKLVRVMGRLSVPPQSSV
jgi:hypothetical protein